MMSTKILLVVLLCICVNAEARKPNIVFILADDYGYNDIGYHNPEMKTPTLDKLANEGVKLENYYVQPICTPTRSQLMSGRYQVSDATVCLSEYHAGEQGERPLFGYP